MLLIFSFVNYCSLFFVVVVEIESCNTVQFHLTQVDAQLKNLPLAECVFICACVCMRKSAVVLVSGLLTQILFSIFTHTNTQTHTSITTIHTTCRYRNSLPLNGSNQSAFLLLLHFLPLFS